MQINLVSDDSIDSSFKWLMSTPK